MIVNINFKSHRKKYLERFLKEPQNMINREEATTPQSKPNITQRDGAFAFGKMCYSPQSSVRVWVAQDTKFLLVWMSLAVPLPLHPPYLCLFFFSYCMFTLREKYCYIVVIYSKAVYTWSHLNVRHARPSCFFPVVLTHIVILLQLLGTRTLKRLDEYIVKGT